MFAALAAPASPGQQAFADSLSAFISQYGSRGPNEWDIHARSWEADQLQPLKLVNGIRKASDADSPQARHARLEARRAVATQTLRDLLSDDAEALGTLDLALASTTLSVPARERTKATSVAVINEVRMAIRELGDRGVEAGLFAAPEDIMMLLNSELDDYVANPAGYQALSAERLRDYTELFDLDPPFIIASDPEPLSKWPRRAAKRVSPLQAGEILTGLGGGAGRFTGRVCVMAEPSDLARLEPGDVLVAPFTDAAWTPLFLIAGAVVVDVGAMNSHAVVVCRELGIPCVLSVTTATSQLVDGMEITVDGTAGTVTVLSVPASITVGL